MLKTQLSLFRTEPDFRVKYPQPQWHPGNSKTAHSAKQFCEISLYKIN